MCTMNVPLPLPNPQDWLSSAGACAKLGVTRVTLLRMVEDGRLRKYTTDDGGQTMYWLPDVMELHAARKRAAGRGVTRGKSLC